MILSGKEIKRQIGNTLIIEPFCEKQLNPNSYNLKLHNELLIYDEPILDMKKEHKTKRVAIPEEGLVIKPNQLYLGRTEEYVKTDHYAPMIEGRSSVARLGIFIHICAGLGHVGSSGYWTLEITAVQPVRIYPHVELCQLFFFTIEGSFTPYKKKYKDSRDIVPSMLYKEFKN